MMNDPRIDFRLVEVLAMLITERSVTRAADRLNISQPAMSHNLSKLRKIFEDPILTRGRDGLIPTARALELEMTAREILDGVARLTAPTPEFNPKLSETTFVVTATEYIEYLLAGGLMAELRAQAPHARMVIRPPDKRLIMGWLERGEVDIRLGWVYEPEPVLRSAPLFEEKLVVIARRGHPQIAGSLKLKEYLGSIHVNSEVAGSRTTGKAITETLGHLARKIETGLQVQSALTIPHAVAASDLIATIPMRLAANVAQELSLQVLDPPMRLPAFRCAAYWHDAVQNDRRHRWFRRLLTRVAKKLPMTALDR